MVCAFILDRIERQHSLNHQSFLCVNRHCYTGPILSESALIGAWGFVIRLETADPGPRCFDFGTPPCTRWIVKISRQTAVVVEISILSTPFLDIFIFTLLTLTCFHFHLHFHHHITHYESVPKTDMGAYTQKSPYHCRKETGFDFH